MRPLLLILLVLAPLIAALAWDVDQPRAQLTLSYVSIQTLDPTRVQASEDVRLSYALFEGLATVDPYTFTVEPGVAERWEVSEDQLTYTFHLRPDARWSSGRPVTARDFRAAWRQNMMPDFAAEYHKFLMYFAGAQAYFQACADRLPRDQTRAAEAAKLFDELVGVKAPDDRTLIVTLDQPTPYFIQLVACWPLFPLPPEAIDAATFEPSTGLLKRDPQWTKPGRIVCNGPYRLADWRFKQQVVLEANPHYWRDWPDMPRTVRLMNFLDHNAAYNAFRSGAVDLILGAVPTFRDKLVADARAGERDDVHPNDMWGTYFYAFNCRSTLADGSPNPFADPRVRRAFAMTIDKRAIVEKVTRLNQTVARRFIPPDSFPHYPVPEGLDCLSDAQTPPQRDEMIDAARALLAEAGYGPTNPFPTVVLMHNTGGGHEDTAQAVAQMWHQALGVGVQFKTHEWKVFLDEYSNGRYMVARASWFGDYADPTTFLDLFATGNGNNDTGFSNERYDALLARASTMADPVARMKVLGEAEALAMNRMMPMVPLYHYMLVHLFDPARVKGVSMHPRGLQFFHRMSVVGR